MIGHLAPVAGHWRRIKCAGSAFQQTSRLQRDARESRVAVLRVVVVVCANRIVAWVVVVSVIFR